MDKKAKYQQPSTKGTPTDTKKNQEVTSCKIFPKSSRRREPPSASAYPKNDQPRKSNAQKTKTFEKKPKSKGYNHGNSKEDSKVVNDESAEFGSVMVQGSKKQNLSHLLNFYYAPREAHSENRTRSGGFNSYNNNHWLASFQRHEFNKEQFLQANCQFVVTAKGDYSRYLNDPDTLIDWTLIQQIKVHSSDNISCPICLSPPVAGKMTRCGHVYCWSCILHYLALSDKTWRKCPICYESVHKSDLKSVVEITDNVLNIGDTVSLQLMRREKGSLIAMPVGQIECDPPTTFLSISENSCQPVYSKLLLAENKDIIDIIESERSQLKIELLDDPHSPENCFIEQALGELLTREQLLFESTKSEIGIKKSVVNNKKINSENYDNATSAITSSEVKHDHSLQLTDDLQNFNDDLNNDLDMSLNDTDVSMNSQKFYYFYQADGGQNIYLHAMNVKMLEMQYGSLKNSPRNISGKLIEKEVGSFTEDLRRRMRYLCHLPITSQFEIVEVDLKPPIISKTVLTYFEDQIISRRRKRNHRENEERKRERKINEENRKLMGKYPTPKFHIESQKHFPQFQHGIIDSMEPLPSESVAASSVASSPTANSCDEVCSAVEVNTWPATGEQGPSFAQMLRTSLSISKKAERKVASEEQLSGSYDNPELEYMPPVYSQYLGDTLAQAFEKSELLNQSQESNNKGKSSKKKKKKGTLLFTTNMARSS